MYLFRQPAHTLLLMLHVSMAFLFPEPILFDNQIAVSLEEAKKAMIMNRFFILV